MNSKNSIMKFLLLFFLSAFAISAQATIHTVSNDPDNPGQYTTVQAAHDAALPGDTLYITPSETSYGNISMNRRLIIIGNGFVTEVDGTISKMTRINDIDLDESLVSSSSGSKFISIIFRGMDAFEIDNITIEQCGVEDRLTLSRCTNVTVKHSIVNLIDGSNGFFGVVSNCIFFSPQRSNYTVKNCVIIGTGGYNSSGLFVDNVIFENNIIIQYPVTASNIQNTSFSNNIFFGMSGDPLPFDTNDNSGSGNLVGVNPQFVEYDIFSGVGDHSFTTPLVHVFDTEDWHLSSGSPGILYGTDGTDVGIYGGQDPWPEVSGYTGRPSMPVITLFQLLNAVVSPDGELEFEIEATTQN